jgi:hypothetical protein
MWYRAFAVLIGVVSIVLALIVLVEPLLALWLLIFFLALALLFIGIDRLVAGITGHPFGQLEAMMPVLGAGEANKPGGAPSGPAPPSKPQ